jgi:hypothetical protein
LQTSDGRGTLIPESTKFNVRIRSNLMETDKPAFPLPERVPERTAAPPPLQTERPSRARMAIAFGIAAVSDFFSIWTEFAPPAQWALDAVTAVALFLILGRRWALLPGLITEAIPGLAVFPAWVLVVLSIIIYDGIKKPK